jgi:hypothetical protein
MANETLTNLVRDFGYDIHAGGLILCRTGEPSMIWRQAGAWVKCENGAFAPVLVGFRIDGRLPNLDLLVGDVYIKAAGITLMRKRRPGEAMSIEEVCKMIELDFEAVQ